MSAASPMGGRRAPGIGAVSAVSVFLALSPAARAAADVESSIGEGRQALHGALRMPDGRAPVRAVLLIPGSGPTDRDGNALRQGVRPNVLKLLAEGLGAQGIASLRFDKRGIGASAGAITAEADLRFDTYVDDVLAWSAFLSAQPRVTCVVLLGHSEGALIAALAAVRRPGICGVISIAGAGRPAAQVLISQLSAPQAGLTAPLLQRALETIAILRSGRTISDPPRQLASLFRPSIQPYLISWFAYDPLAALAAVRVPVLILQGTTDLQVDPADARALAAAQPAATLVLLPGVNHVLKAAPAERAANLATYADPDLPLAPQVLPTVIEFVKQLGRQ